MAVCLTYVVSSVSLSIAFAQQNFGQFEGHCDAGPVKHAGSVTYDPHAERYIVAGSGANMWLGRDEFHFVWKRLKGDFILTASARFVGEGADPHRKLGWIARKTLDADSPYADVALHGDGLVSLQFRRVAGGDTKELKSSVRGADVIQLQRREGEFISPPRIIQRLLFSALAPMARARGYKAINPEYLGPTGKAAAQSEVEESRGRHPSTWGAGG